MSELSFSGSKKEGALYCGTSFSKNNKAASSLLIFCPDLNLCKAYTRAPGADFIEEGRLLMEPRHSENELLQIETLLKQFFADANGHRVYIKADNNLLCLLKDKFSPLLAEKQAKLMPHEEEALESPAPFVATVPTCIR